MSDSEFFWLPPDSADPRGLVALDRNLSAARLVSAYRRGIFPWPDSSLPGTIPWVCPPRRAILEFDALHIPKNLRRAQRALARLRFTHDAAFPAVIAACAAAPRRQQSGTWIIPPMISAYTELHRQGHAHSIEAWDGAELLGGLYGVSIGRVFFGESMFSHATDASKIALYYLCEQLRQWEYELIDCQISSAHLSSLGAQEISRKAFLALLAPVVQLQGHAGRWDFNVEVPCDPAHLPTPLAW